MATGCDLLERDGTRRQQVFGVLLTVLIGGCFHEGKSTEDETADLEALPRILTRLAASEPRDGGIASTKPGVIVVGAPEGSALAKAGIQAGDILSSWERSGNLTVGKGGGRGELLSPFEFHHIRLEEAPRGTVVLMGERDGLPRSWQVQAGDWLDVELSPRWSSDLLETDGLARKHLEEENFQKGLSTWTDLIAQLAPGQDESSRMWLSFEFSRTCLRAYSGQEQQTECYQDHIEAFKNQGEHQREFAYVNQELGDMALLQLNDREQATEFYDAAFRARQAIDAGSLTLAESLQRMGILALYGNDLSLAQEYFAKTLEIRERLAPGSLEVGKSLNNLGAVARLRGDTRQAYALVLQAFRIEENVMPDSPRLSQTLMNLGSLAKGLGNLKEAQGFYLRALEIVEQESRPSLEYARYLNSLGNLVRDLGDLSRAREILLDSLRIIEQIVPESSIEAGVLNNLGIVHRMLGSLDEASRCLNKALQIKQRLNPGSLEVATSLSGLGDVAIAQGNLKQAQDLLLQALEISEELSPISAGTASKINSLGIIARHQQQLGEAHELFSRALRIQEQVAPSSQAVSDMLGNLGLVAFDRGDLKEAESLHAQALKMREESAPQSLSVANILVNLGLVRSNHRDWKGAQEFYRRALEIQESLAPGTFLTAYVLNRTAEAMAAQGELERAATKSALSLNVLEQQIGNLGGSYETQAEFRAKQGRFYTDALTILTQLQRVEESFHVTERSRARTFLAMLAEKELVFKLEIPRELELERERLALQHDRVLSRLSRLSLSEDESEVAGLRRELVAIDRERSKLGEQIRGAAPRLAALHYPLPLDADMAREALDPGTLMVSYAVGERALTIFALSHQGPLSMATVDIGESDLRRRVQRLGMLTLEAAVDTHLGSERSRSLTDASRALYLLLVKPIEERIQKCSRILIVPDGPLHALPFASLVREDSDGNSQYLVEWKPIHRSLSMTAYAELRRDRPDPSSDQQSVRLTAFGDPSYPDYLVLPNAEKPGSALPADAVLRSLSTREGFNFHWRSLPYSRREVEGIASLFPPGQAQVHLGTDALEERVKSLDPRVRTLHLAAHAVTDEHLPLNSFVALTIPEDLPESQDNGLLQAWEILEQVRINADLVVLSGCSTGMGKALRGEGMIGLTRAFQYAGARSLMSTLWNIDDQTQAELMIHFYRHLGEGLTKDEALRAAQIQMISEPIMSVDAEGNPMQLENASAPFYWAGVQLYGDWM